MSLGGYFPQKNQESGIKNEFGVRAFDQVVVTLVGLEEAIGVVALQVKRPPAILTSPNVA